MKVFLLLALVPFLVNCGGNSTPRGASLPILTSPALAATWGAPETEETDTGYVKTYRNPAGNSESVIIKGTRKIPFGLSFPPNIVGQEFRDGEVVSISTPQVWQRVMVAGRSARYYQSLHPMGGRPSRFIMMGIELTSPEGIRGTYSVIVDGSNEQMQKWVSELRFTH